MGGVDALIPSDSLIYLQNSRIECRIRNLIGAGGQGEVYQVLVPGGKIAQTLALKWYYPEWATGLQYETLARLVKQDPPSRRFLWPIDLAIADDRDGFGYVMPLRPDYYSACADIMSGRQEISFSAILIACLQLADSFLSLHACGLCYRDISFGNAFIDPITGNVLVADNDNVAVDGSASPGIRGTDRFMAPEVVRKEALPNAGTDLYSLSVLLFYLLMMHHPLEGRRLGDIAVLGWEETVEIYGRDPLFVFDPNNDTNAPDPSHDTNALVYWPIYPQMLRDLFKRAFTVGLHDPMLRVRESEWRDCMAQLLDLVIPCKCGVDVFVETDGTQTVPCWSCKSAGGALVRLARLVLDPGAGGQVVILYEGKRLYAHHIRSPRFDYQHTVAKVVRHPEVAEVNGLRNLSSLTWLARLADGREVPVPPGRSVTIASGTAISFGSVTGLFTSG